MHGHRPEMECPGSGRSTVVTANEHGVVLRYPGTFGSSLVESPYGKLGSSESTCTNTKVGWMDRGLCLAMVNVKI